MYPGKFSIFKKLTFYLEIKNELSLFTKTDQK